MNYSTFAMHCPACEEINEPTDKSRTDTGKFKAAYRCQCNNTWQQVFEVNHQAPEITPPEETKPEELPPPPDTEVMEWSDEQKDTFIANYGLEAYQKLVARHFRNGEAYAEQPVDETVETKYPAPDTAPKDWTEIETRNFIAKFGRDKYHERVREQYSHVEDN